MHLTKVNLTEYGRDRMAEDRYALHKRLCAGFPNGNVHLERSEEFGFLFAVQGSSLLIQSAIQPDLKRAFAPCGDVLNGPAEELPLNIDFSMGQTVCFRLEAIPHTNVDSKRVPIYSDDERLLWFEQRCLNWGIKPLIVDGAAAKKKVQSKYLIQNGSPRQLTMTFTPFVYYGALEVINPMAFRQKIINGFGSSKGFGFGMMVVKGK